MTSANAGAARSVKIACTLTFGPGVDLPSRLGRFVNYSVRIDGEDFEIIEVTGEGLSLKRWDDEAGEGRGELITKAWKDFDNLHIY